MRLVGNFSRSLMTSLISRDQILILFPRLISTILLYPPTEEVRPEVGLHAQLVQPLNSGMEGSEPHSSYGMGRCCVDGSGIERRACSGESSQSR